MMDKKILILGGSSYVGRHLFKRLGNQKSIATYCNKRIDNAIHFDSLSMDITGILKDPEEISHAVILLGDTNPETCAANIKRSQKLNVDSIKIILNQFKKWDIKPIFTSSEFVFDGTKGNYIERDVANPILTYGRQKLEIEKYLEDNFDDFVVLRLAKVFGSEPSDGTIFTKWLDIIKDNQTINCASDQIFSPVYIDDVVEGFIKSIECNCKGLFHLAGRSPFSRIELLKMLLGCINEYKSINVEIVPKSIHDFQLREKRPVNVSMKPDKLIKTTGLKLSATEDVCKEIVSKKFQK